MFILFSVLSNNFFIYFFVYHFHIFTIKLQVLELDHEESKLQLCLNSSTWVIIFFYSLGI